MKEKRAKRRLSGPVSVVVSRLVVRVVLVVISGILSYAPRVRAADIHVPSDQSSIQAAINAANGGDVIIVDCGTYSENLNFNGKAVTVRSVNPDDSDIVAATIIDGNQADSVITFINGEGINSVLNGFTLQNGAGMFGGGISCENSSPSITNCIISQNSAKEVCGGIFCKNSSPSIINCTISQNSDGGIYCDANSSPSIINCTISQNSESGICCWGSSPTITNCIISGNSASESGGGIFCCDDSLPSIINCTISGNSAGTGGGGIYCCNDSSLIITNCILWNNEPDEILVEPDTTLTVTYSDIPGGYTGEGNLAADPLFIDPNAGNYHLRRTSPCINAGKSGDGLPTYDKEGNPRGSQPDLGAYEYIDNDKVSVTLRIEPAMMKMISSYVCPDDPKATSVFGDEVREDYDYKKLFKIGTYDPEINGYIEYGKDLKVGAGRAYWCYARDGLDIDFNGKMARLDDDAEVKLLYNQDTGNGWNMIACPNKAAYEWDHVEVVEYDNDGNSIFGPISINQLGADNNYIYKGLLWRWDGETYEYYDPYGSYASELYEGDNDPFLRPTEGYWVRVMRENVSLKFKQAFQVEPPERKSTGKLLRASGKSIATFSDSPPLPPGSFGGSAHGSSKTGNISGCFISTIAFSSNL